MANLMKSEPNAVTLQLSRAELKSLLAFVYLGAWMQSGNDSEAPPLPRDSAIDAVFEAAFKHGLTEYLRRDPVTGELAETVALDALLDPVIEEYNMQSFLDELAHRIARAIQARRRADHSISRPDSANLEDFLELESQVCQLIRTAPGDSLDLLADYAEARLKFRP